MLRDESKIQESKRYIKFSLEETNNVSLERCLAQFIRDAIETSMFERKIYRNIFDRTQFPIFTNVTKDIKNFTSRISISHI